MTSTSQHQARAVAMRPRDAARRPGRGRRLARRLMQGLAVTLGLMLTGSAAQFIAERRDAAAHPAPGELVQLPDGRRLHLQVAGDHRDGPTVVLETGMGGTSAAWAWIQPALSRHVTVVSYDRAGLGWSDPSPHQPGAEPVIADLRAALRQRGLAAPYVLVGHSLGAHYMRAFAAQHPEDVVGVVLVDPSHEDQSAALDMNAAQAGRMMAGLQAATGLGLTRLYNPLKEDLRQLPEPQRSQAVAEQLKVANVRAMRAEWAAMDQIGAELKASGATLGDLPLRILIAAGAPDDRQQRTVDIMTGLRADLARLSTNAQLIVLDDAQHVTIVTDPDYAAVVTETVLGVVKAGASPAR